jgi:hypothetical protein
VASAVIRSRARERFFNLVDLVSQLEQEKAVGRSGRLINCRGSNSRWMKSQWQVRAQMGNGGTAKL